MTTAGRNGHLDGQLQVRASRADGHLVHPRHRDHLGHNDGDDHRHRPLRRHGGQVRHNNSQELLRDIAHDHQGRHQAPCGRHSKVNVTTAGEPLTSTGNYKFVPPCPDHHLVHPRHRDDLGHNDGDHHRHRPLRRHGGQVRHNNSQELHRDIAHDHQGRHQAPRGRHSDGQGHHGWRHGHRGSDYKFVAPVPTITSFTPATGTTSGTTTVTITGPASTAPRR